MRRRILIPLDGSRLAEQVLAYLPHLLPSGAELLLLQTATLQPLASPLSTGAETWRSPGLPPHPQAARQYLEGVRQSLLNDYPSISIVVEERSEGGGIVEVARQQRADLIAMTTHGASGLGHGTVDRLSEAVLQQAPCPVLFVRATREAVPPRPLRRLLVALDGSMLAEQALPHASALARQKQAELILLRATDPLTEHEMRAIVRARRERDALLEQFRHEAMSYLTRQQQALQREGLRCGKRVIAAPAGVAILQVAAEEQVDLIVMSTHGRSGIGKLVYGSVTAHVLRDTIRPLLAVRAQHSM